MTDTHPVTPDGTVSVLVPTGMLGAGFPPETVARGIALGADVIAIDGGSTDSGPHYLGTASAKTADGAVLRDLRMVLPAAAAAGIPVVIGSCGTAGTDAGVDWVAGLVDRVLAEAGLELTVARIYSEQRPQDLVAALESGAVHPLAPPRPLDAATLLRCTHIVGVMGHEPIAEALQGGADVVLAGRATDTALAAAYPLMHGMPAGPTWHAAKIVECGGQCTTRPTAGGVIAHVDATGFTIEALNPAARCTPQTVAAHMLYETVNPHEMREPAGTLLVADATYTALDDRRVRVEGSVFQPAEQYTVKLEGAAAAGYQTVSFTAIRDPEVLAQIDLWAATFNEALTERVRQTLNLERELGDYDVDLRLYGHNAVLAGLDNDLPVPHEVGVMLVVSATTQPLATAIAKVANPLMLHLPLPGMGHLPSFAFATSPAEIERGACYEFVLNHVVAVDDPTAMFRLTLPAQLAHA